MVDHHVAVPGVQSNRSYCVLAPEPAVFDLPAVDLLLLRLFVEVCPATPLRKLIGPIRAFWNDLEGPLLGSEIDLLIAAPETTVSGRGVERATQWRLVGPPNTVLRATRYSNFPPQHRGWPEGLV